MVEEKPIKEKAIFVGNGRWSKIIQLKLKNKIDIIRIYDSQNINDFFYSDEKYIFVLIGPYLNNEFIQKNYNKNKYYFVEKPFFTEELDQIKNIKNNIFINNLHFYNRNIFTIKKKIDHMTDEIFIKIGSKIKKKNVYLEWAPHIFSLLEILDLKLELKNINNKNNVYELIFKSSSGIRVRIIFGYFDQVFTIKLIDKSFKIYFSYDDIKKIFFMNNCNLRIPSNPLDVSLRLFLNKNYPITENYKFNSKISKKYINILDLLSSKL